MFQLHHDQPLDRFISKSSDKTFWDYRFRPHYRLVPQSQPTHRGLSYSSLCICQRGDRARTSRRRERYPTKSIRTGGVEHQGTVTVVAEYATSRSSNESFCFRACLSPSIEGTFEISIYTCQCPSIGKERTTGDHDSVHHTCLRAKFGGSGCFPALPASSLCLYMH